MIHREFFDVLSTLNPLRIISPSGASVFEAIGRFEAYGIAEGHMNAITTAYHWHVALERFRHLRTHDEVHERSGRRVLFAALHEARDQPPFVLIYLHRAKGAPFEPAREAAFAALHARAGAGVELRS